MAIALYLLSTAAVGAACIFVPVALYRASAQSARELMSDWTAADFDSYEVLVSIGVRRPQVHVARARASRPARRTIRAALRTH